MFSPGQEVSCDKNAGLQTKPVYFIGQAPDASFSAGQIEYNRTMVRSVKCHVILPVDRMGS